MARGRMISKAISLDEKVNALSDDTCRLLFTWLITHLDCEGRMHGDPQTVKSIVFPRRPISTRKVEKYLNELQENQLLLRYFVNGNAYLLMENFEKHQTGLRKDKEIQSQIPPVTPDQRRSEGGKVPPQVKVKVKVKEEDKEEGMFSSLNKEEALDAYRQNIGEPSEDMENEIALACIKFSPAWLIDAIREAVLQNKKSWPYIAGILKNWQKYGKGAEVLNVQKPDPG